MELDYQQQYATGVYPETIILRSLIIMLVPEELFKRYLWAPTLFDFGKQNPLI